MICTKVLDNDEADINNQISQKYKEENIRSYLKRLNSLVALMPTLRGGGGGGGGDSVF